MELDLLEISNTLHCFRCPSLTTWNHCFLSYYLQISMLICYLHFGLVHLCVHGKKSSWLLWQPFSILQYLFTFTVCNRRKTVTLFVRGKMNSKHFFKFIVPPWFWYKRGWRNSDVASAMCSEKHSWTSFISFHHLKRLLWIDLSIVWILN